ncbi:MAG: SDR family oxidoreductase [Verrucomicrobia bacterium]|nr:SDR family oxidoreductase [Verrucomicrobiota bacterium]
MLTNNLSSQLSGKVALITGSTQGLGAATARLFAERGASGIVLCGRNREKGLQVAGELKDCQAEFVQADLSKLEDCFKVIEETDTRFGRLDVLVNSAGVTDRGTILDTSPELYQRIFDTNLRAPFFLMQGAAKIMLRSGIAGSIINVLSIVAHGGPPFITAYSSSKGALLTLTKNVAFSLMPHHIRVNGLTIGWMNTPGEDRVMRLYHGAQDGWKEQAEKELPFGRMLEAEEVARAIAFLASDESGMMTGSIIDFDQFVLGSYDKVPRPERL